jgi:protein TonB
MAEMFKQTFVDGVGKTNKSWTVTLSFTVQILAVGVMILLPLIFTDVLPKAQLVSFLQAPAPPPPPPPPPPPVPKQVVVKQAPRQFDAGRLMAPKEIPKNVASIVEDALPPSMSLSVGGVQGGIPGGIPGGVIGGLGVGAAPPPPPPKVEVVKPATPSRIRVGGNVQGAKLIKKPTPVYPPLAKQARIQGTVKFTAVIGKDGTIQNLQLVSGHPLLVASAQEAVKQWVYQPTLLNGEPVEVITEIDVNFTLSQ